MTARDRYGWHVNAKLIREGEEKEIPQLYINMSENDGYTYMRGNVDKRLDSVEVLQTATLEGLEQILNNKILEDTFKRHEVKGDKYIAKIREMVDNKKINYF
ncbi:hypothetical protein KY334_06535 [Candidatus Woesearchaeota archaeon]|nr:hypothetical protein [Candidatus Woesearchaeota archaeon]